MPCRTVSLVVLLSVAACGGSLRDRADEALKRHDYEQAAVLYDEAVALRPGDPALVAKRTEARHGVLARLFQANQAARRSGDRALAAQHLTRLLAQRDAWTMAIDPRLADALAAEVGMVGSDLAIAIEHRTSTVGPLAGEALLLEHAGLLRRADFGDRLVVLAGGVVRAGRAVCDRLAPDATTPYWRHVVERYCAHFGPRGRFGEVALPGLVAGLALDSQVTGASADEERGLRDALDQALRASVWYAPTGTQVLRAELAGQISIERTARTIGQHTSYDEQEPYTDYETTQESYQEPYDDTESYAEDVPYTETETSPEVCESCDASGSCERRTCSTSRTVTKHRTEWRTRTVTKYRTAWRTVTNPVTHYRTVTHPFHYTANEITGRYAVQLAVRVIEQAAPGAAELAGVLASTRYVDARSGIEHDVTFAPAGVWPVQADVPSREATLATQRSRLARALRANLDERWRQRFCGATAYDREAAARCAYLDHAGAPAAVHTALAAAFGADEAGLGGVISRAGGE